MKRLLCLGLICYFCCLSMIVYGNEKTSPFYLAELKCENLIDPLGIDNVTPHFSWKLKGDVEQQAKVQYEYYLTQAKKYDQTIQILHDVNKHIKAIEGLYSRGVKSLKR